ncbi:uncharacterized protein [Glycine max]|uniref:uncharacterized protein n=1 Tax=Glycine max TaxID=3847 RepID=UPI0003DE79A1|nr:uncharacterized protein LOC102660011 [Glycine max]|eukprot:XP_006575897.1 uncharacterized protein LOC102660011 [Glycine max]
MKYDYEHTPSKAFKDPPKNAIVHLPFPQWNYSIQPNIIKMPPHWLALGTQQRVRSSIEAVSFGLQWLRWVCDYKVMACVADKIKLIDGSREALKLFVRITYLWFIGIPGKTEQAEMVVVDSDGYEIHVVCKQDQLKSRKANLKENLTYVIHNFKVIKNDGKFRVCDHEYKLCFTGVTVVRQCDMEQLHFRKFRFVDFFSVIAGHFKIGLLFLSYLNDIEDEKPIVILLTHARIKEAQGSYPASISNSFKASKLMINDLVLEIQEFRERKSNVSFFKQEFVCVTVSKITTIVMDNYSWCYLAWGQCYKKADMQTVPFTCLCGKENDQPVLRYRVEVMVNHKGEQTKFLIWDRESAQLIGQSADEVNRLKIEQSMSITVDHDRSMLGSSEPTELESQSVSVTGDHDPLLRIPLTPTKRVSSDELDNE